MENKRDYMCLINHHHFGGAKTKTEPEPEPEPETDPDTDTSVYDAESYWKTSVFRDIVPENLKKFKRAFEEPFSYIYSPTYHKEKDGNKPYWLYPLKDISLTMFDEDWKPEKIDLTQIDLNNHIKTVYMYQEGIHEEKPWWFIGELENPSYGRYYVYYEAECDYTGFDCQGTMTMYISNYFDRIIRFALPEKVRTKFWKKVDMKLGPYPYKIIPQT